MDGENTTFRLVVLRGREVCAVYDESGDDLEKAKQAVSQGAAGDYIEKEFKTKEELDAFIEGVGTGQCWMGITMVEV